MSYITIGEAAKQVGRSAQTIKSWYVYAEQEECLDLLPVMRRDLDIKGTRYFNSEDIPKLVQFRDSLKYGQIATVSRPKWGKRASKK